jgi:hypothetical protein
MRIKFLKDYEVKAVDGPVYKKGQEIDVSDTSAWHFINRGAAEACGVKPAPKAETEKPAK